MAKSKDDIKYGVAQAKLSDDEALRIRYKAGTPLEGGKIADSEPVDLFPGARNIARQQQNDQGLIAESEPVELFASAQNLEEPKGQRGRHKDDDQGDSGEQQHQLQR